MRSAAPAGRRRRDRARGWSARGRSGDRGGRHGGEQQRTASSQPDRWLSAPAATAAQLAGGVFVTEDFLDALVQALARPIDVGQRVLELLELGGAHLEALADEDGGRLGAALDRVGLHPGVELAQGRLVHPHHDDLIALLAVHRVDALLEIGRDEHDLHRAADLAAQLLHADAHGLEVDPGVVELAR